MELPYLGLMTCDVLLRKPWTSPCWRQIRRLYNPSPSAVRPLFPGFFGTLIYAGVWFTAPEPTAKGTGHGFLV